MSQLVKTKRQTNFKDFKRRIQLVRVKIELSMGLVGL
jgi:hypothetical protein